MHCSTSRLLKSLLAPNWVINDMWWMTYDKMTCDRWKETVTWFLRWGMTCDDIILKGWSSDNDRKFWQLTWSNNDWLPLLRSSSIPFATAAVTVSLHSPRNGQFVIWDKKNWKQRKPECDPSRSEFGRGWQGRPLSLTASCFLIKDKNVKGNIVDQEIELAGWQ